ncbi:MAG: HEAT repeat domain-containing protein, partial [Bacillota bacterium]
MGKPRYTAIISAVMALAVCAMTAGRVNAADNKASAREKELKLISVLQSDAPAAEKAITCKQLAIYGNKEAVPALAALLPNKDLSSWARIALEAIPDPAADEALREAMGKVQGRLLVGVINSIGYRRDAKAVDGLVQQLKNPDEEVASCAAAALGRIGGEKAAATLAAALASVPTAVRPAVAEGCIYCAERFLAGGNREKAIQLYDAVRKTELPKQRILEATRGAILARQSAGIPLLVETLRSPDKAMFGIALRTARELSEGQVT